MVCLMNQITAGLCVYTNHVLLICKISMVSWRALPFIRRQVIMLSGVPHPKAPGGGDWYRAAKACYYRMAFSPSTNSVYSMYKSLPAPHPS